MFEIELTRTFDAAHRVVGHQGKCARLHGHTYRVDVTVRASRLISTDSSDKQGPAGFVCDFADIKELVDLWDHSTLLWAEDPLSIGQPETNEFPGILGGAVRVVSMKNPGVIRLDFNPTSENMAKHLAETLAQRILADTHRRGTVTVRVSETENTSSTFTASIGMPSHIVTD